MARELMHFSKEILANSISFLQINYDFSKHMPIIQIVLDKREYSSLVLEYCK